MNCKEFQKLPIDEQRRILADEAKEFAERQYRRRRPNHD